MTTDYVFRHATPDDTGIIAEHRYLMFAEMGMDTTMLKKAQLYYGPWLEERLKNGVYHGILVEYDEQVIAGAGMWISHGAPLPNLHSADNRRANIVNVYTNPHHRRQGIARQLLERLIALAREEGYPVVQLHASEAGRPLYESVGFRDTNELRLLL